MADFTTSNLITRVEPDRYATGILTNQIIGVSFLRDIDQTTLGPATISLQVVGTVAPVPFTYTYANRQLQIIPTGGLLPNTTYSVTLVGDTNPTVDAFSNNITGIRDITGNGFVGLASWQFRTTNIGVPATPTLMYPVEQTAVAAQPTFSFSAVTGATYYDIQVSIDNTFGNIYWPLPTDTYNQTLTTVTPARPFAYNQEYWWRVRATTVYSGSAVPGGWSDASSFYYGNPTYGTVTPDDAPMGVIPPTAFAPVVVSACPMPGVSNIPDDDYPNRIEIKIQGEISLAQIGEHSLRVVGVPVDGTFTPGDFRPIFTPSLNGSQFGGGGVTIPGPVDSYQQILMAGKLSGVAPAGSFDGAYTTITMDVPQTYWQDNNFYTLTLDLQEFQAPQEWSFTTAWKPVFNSVRSIRQMTDFFIPELTDDDIWFTIRRNSLHAIWIQVYWPTKVDAQWQIYQPPISFNVNNPNWYVREYVRLKSVLDFLRMKYYSLLVKPKAMLGDFSYDQESSALKENLAQAISEIKLEMQPFEDALRGHSNRGYARGQSSLRGAGSFGQEDTWNFPYRVHDPRSRRRF